MKQRVQDYGDKSFGMFVLNRIERGEHEDLMKAQHFFWFFTIGWAKAATQSLDQRASARNLLDINVQAKGNDLERRA